MRGAHELGRELERDLARLVRLAVLQRVLDELRRRESRNPVRGRRRRRHKGTGPAAPAKNQSETPIAPEPSGETPAPLPRLRVLPKKTHPAGPPRPFREVKPAVSPPDDEEQELGLGEYDPELEAWG